MHNRMRGGATVKHDRNAFKHTRRLRRPSDRPAYYMLKQKTLHRHKNYFRKVLEKLRKKQKIRQSTRVRRKPVRYDPSTFGTRRTRKVVPNSTAHASATVPYAQSAIAPNSFKVAERDALIYKARELYGASDATKKIRAAFIRAYIRARSAGTTPADALFAAENEIIVAAKAGAIGSVVAFAGPSAAAAAPSAAAAAPSAAPVSILFNNDDGANNNNDNIEEIIMGVRGL
jgi:hypothetical protein